MTMSTAHNHSIDRLLADWRAHDDLKRAGASVPELWRSHQRLADARDGVRSAR